ncbi:cadherin [Apostichopus japonicus]|uniref:Cadherin n=1 Tax=Stichopus japonicus TaxID=307972 RepID=A0A2G8KLS8_STIJA|nr:cadherin [Apostichopus japonicus]
MGVETGATHFMHSTIFKRNSVIPNMSLDMEGMDYGVIDCQAHGGRPQGHLKLVVTNENEEEINKTEASDKSLIQIEFPVDIGSFHVRCSSWQYGPNITTWRNDTFEIKESTTESSSPSTSVPSTLVSDVNSSPHDWLQKPWVPPSIAAAVASFLAFCLYKGIKRAKASLTANIPTSDIDSWKNATLPRTNESTLKRSFTGPPKLQLPKIPTDEEVSQYSAESENYYATTNETSSGGKMFGENDMCLILNLKMGEIYNRWMGTIAVSRESNRCVVFTTVTESQAMKKEIHWDAFVKRALEMPNTDHITSIEGIAIDKANFYLINEHLICETLESKVIGKSDPNAKTSPFLHDGFGYNETRFWYHVGHGSDPLLWACPIKLKVVIHRAYILLCKSVVCCSRTSKAQPNVVKYPRRLIIFLHPGLSLKKVLLSNQGDCKLYDFCLSEDASEIVATKKMQVIASLNHFAPEALLRNEYNQGSDVWSIAVLMWEMMSVGNSPFLVDQELHTEEAIIGPGKPWPERYQQLQNKSLFECWNKDYSARPTVSNLKESFTKIFEAIMENSFYEIPTSDLYAPMTAVTNFGGT